MTQSSVPLSSITNNACTVAPKGDTLSDEKESALLACVGDFGGFVAVGLGGFGFEVISGEARL